MINENFNKDLNNDIINVFFNKKPWGGPLTFRDFYKQIKYVFYFGKSVNGNFNYIHVYDSDDKKICFFEAKKDVNNKILKILKYYPIETIIDYEKK